MSNETIIVFTIGYARKDAGTFFGRLEEIGVRGVVDIRLRNTSYLAGFTKRDDFGFFLRRIADIDYVHVPKLAPTAALLDDYQKKRIDWVTYERRFNKIIAERRIESVVTRRDLKDASLLCSEPEPDKCHRKIVAEYPQRAWGDVQIEHIL